MGNEWPAQTFVEFRVVRDPRRRRHPLVTMFGWEVDLLTLSLARHVLGNEWRTLFNLRCDACYRWSLGCSEHWFCDLCEPCRVASLTDECETEA